MTRCLYCGSKNPVKFELCQNCLDNIGFGVKFNQEVEILDELLIACEYKSLIKDIIIDFKFRDKTYYYKILADIMTDLLLKSKIIKDYKYISFVPMHKKDLKLRGYNQAELIAKEIADNTFLELIKPIKKSKFTQQQVRLANQNDRKKNIENAFEITKKIDGNIIIVDDVITSAATVSEIAKIIKDKNQIKIAALIAASPSII